MLNLDKNHIMELPSTVSKKSSTQEYPLPPPPPCHSSPTGGEMSVSACALDEGERSDRSS